MVRVGKRNDGQRKVYPRVLAVFYENEDILVEHRFMSYPDNTREAVMLVAMLSDGKVIKMETGATSLD